MLVKKTTAMSNDEIIHNGIVGINFLIHRVTTVTPTVPSMPNAT